MSIVARRVRAPLLGLFSPSRSGWVIHGEEVDVQYFVTGATGFIGRQLIPLLLARGGEINVLVRQGSGHRFAALRERLDPSGAQLRSVAGDIGERGLAVAEKERSRLSGATIFHLAAIYDLTASAEDTSRANIDG